MSHITATPPIFEPVEIPSRVVDGRISGLSVLLVTLAALGAAGVGIVPDTELERVVELGADDAH